MASVPAVGTDPGSTAGAFRQAIQRRFNYDERSAMALIAPVAIGLALVALFPIVLNLWAPIMKPGP